MEIALPSGATVTVKDNMKPGDRFAVEGAVDLVIEDGKTYIHAPGPAQWKAFLTQVVTAWSFPVPIPLVAGQQVLDEYPDQEEDDDALHEALQERYERIVRRRPTTPRPSSPTSATSTSS